MLPDDLGPIEVRVVGSLIEKELSTPDYYPLSLNALTNACNQSSNRDPVMSLDEEAVRQAIDALRRRGLVRSIQGIGSRVPKYQHLLAESADLTRAELAVLGTLALRGPQTLGEVKARATRLMEGEGEGEGEGGDATSLEAALEALTTRDPPVVTRLARRPGQKEARFAHRLSGDVTVSGDEEHGDPPPQSGDRIAVLEDAVQQLRDDVADLRGQLAAFRKQFE
ncbi:MAG TPA: YceH family protein [Gemmatimonadaceae bacterium]